VPIGVLATSRGIDVRSVDKSATGRHIAARDRPVSGRQCFQDRTAGRRPDARWRPI